MIDAHELSRTDEPHGGVIPRSLARAYARPMSPQSESQRLEEAIRKGRELRAIAADFLAAAKHDDEDLDASLRERLLPSQPKERDGAA